MLVDAEAAPTIRARLRDNKGLAIIVVVVVVAAIVIASAQSRRSAGRLDPDGVDPTGSRAVAAILAAQGVTVVRVTTAAAAADALTTHAGDATFLVMPTAELSQRMVDAVSVVPRRHTVLVAPDGLTLTALAPWVVDDHSSDSTDEIAPACDWWLAVKAGPLPPEGTSYSSDLGGVHECWNGLVVDDSATHGSGSTTVIGSEAAFTNQRLADSGYAALALDSLGQSSTLVWWLPSYSDPLQVSGDGPATIEDLAPPWVRWVVIQLGIVALFAVWWRGRRLGRVVVEPLPVVVRATETVEGRARLYRRGKARGHAADALREATAARLRARLALARTTDISTLSAAVAARSGRAQPDVLHLLSPGRVPPDDLGLTRLADLLDQLENEVRLS